MKKLNAFVLMPFAEEFKDVYKHLIFEELERAGYIVIRADDIKSQNNIMSDVVKGIITSDLIIADLTGSNPNVYYELGIAHALDKKVILITQAINELPFDLRSYRVVGYGLNFVKMAKAKKELFEFATEAFKSNLPFGNPVKDFGNINRQSNELSITSNEVMPENLDGEMGLLDHRVNLEDGFADLSKIIAEVGFKLSDEVTPEIEKTTKKITSGNYTTKQKRDIVRELSTHLEKYSSFIKPNNEKYRYLLKNVENSLEYMLSGNIEVEGDAKVQLEEFLDALAEVEKSALQGRQGFISLIDTMGSLPKIEQSFDRANVFMVSELKDFVENIDQTISVIAIGSQLGRAFINKL